MKKLLIISLLLVFSLVSCTNVTPSTDLTSEENDINEVNSNSENIVDLEENELDLEDNELDLEENNEQTDEAIEEESEELALNQPIPNLEFTNMAGETVLIEDYQGKIILLNFWATWCSFCDKEMPDLEIVSQYEDVQVFAINSRESLDTIETYITQGAYTFDVIPDEIGKFSEMFYVSALPTTYFINEEGILLGAVPGMLTLEQMNQIIQDIRDDKL